MSGTTNPTSTKGAERAEAVEAQIVTARQRLADMATGDDARIDSARLGDQVREVAFLEGKHYVMVELGQMQDQEVPKTKQVETMLRILVQGADDTWSGRGNDNKRAFFDGVRDTVLRLLYSDLSLD